MSLARANINIMQKLRQSQAKMVNNVYEQELYSELMHTLYATRTQSVIPPWPDMVDPVDRINFEIFWGMAQVLQQITIELQTINPGFRPISDDLIVEMFQQTPTETNAREHPIFELLVDTISKLQDQRHVPEHH